MKVGKRAKVLALRNNGLPYAEIGLKLGISRERVRQLIKGRPEIQKPDLDSAIMLTTSEASKLLGVHVNTIRRWTAQRVIRVYRIGSRGDRRFRRDDLEKLLKVE